MAEHACVAGIEVSDDKLAFDGHCIESVAKRVGRTPFYAHSTAALHRRVSLARAMLPAGVQLHYAVKANPHEPVVRFLASRVDGADVASIGELRLALASGFSPEHIGFAGPGKRADEIAEAIECGVTVTAESELQLRAIADAANRSQRNGRAGQRAQAAIRVNPAHELRASGMRMGGGASAFGIDEEQVPQVLDLADRLGVRVVGLHFYPGSQNLRAEAVAEALRANAAAARRLMGKRQDWQWLNLGGGFGVPYAAGEREIDAAPIKAALADIVESRSDKGPETARLTLRIELGRYLVADAGIYVCQVIDRKVSRGRTMVVVDGGLHHNQAAAGNFGQVIKRPYPLMNATHPNAPLEAVDIVGPLCTPMDSFGRDVRIPQPLVGDLIVVLRSGAYGRSASPVGFLGHGDCSEVLLESAEDVATTTSEVDRGVLPLER